MRVSLNWLKEFIDLDVDADALCEKMTMLGLEIEAVERPGEEIQEVVVGRILSIDPHPDADKLVVCKTDVGEGEPLQIVCGATNMAAGDRVPTAKVGGQLPGGFKIGKRKMRGVESQGMMCSARELGLGEDHSGLLILEPDAEIGGDARELLGLNDTVVEIEVTPNRNDWSGMIGIARELAAAYGTSFRTPEIAINESKTDVSGLSSVTIEDPALCARYVGRVIESVTIGPSPAWLARRLIAAGQRPISNVVDITNYVLLETGHPLHAFDLDKLAEKRIVVRSARAGETITTIDQEKRALDADMLVIADATEPVAVAGVMGGFDSEVGESTTNLFLESAHFDPVSIRRTARRLNMITEASQRFQRGADPEMALYAANRAAQLFQDVAGGRVAAGVLDEYPAPPVKPAIALRYGRTDAFLGTAVAPERQRQILIGLGFETVEKSAGAVTVRVPTWRHDAAHEADLIEEVARLHGYDAVPVTMPKVRRNEDNFAPEYGALRRLREYLVRTGMTEVITWTFSSESETGNARLGAAYETMVRLENPLSENHATMRTSLVPGLLRVASNNLRKNRLGILAFEAGPVYHPSDGDALPGQSTQIALVLAGPAGRKHWSSPERTVDFYDVKGRVEALLDFIGVQNALFEADTAAGLWGGERGRIVVDGKSTGELGLVSNAVQDAFEIPAPVYMAWLDLDPILGIRTAYHEYEQVPAFPPSLRDLAIVVDAAVPVGELREHVHKSGGKLLTGVELFDIFTGKQVPEGKKSVALALTFQSKERTLKDKDTQKAVDKILKTLEKEYGATLR